MILRILSASAAWLAWAAGYLAIDTAAGRIEDLGPGDALGILAAGFALGVLTWVLSLVISIVLILRARSAPRARIPPYWEFALSSTFAGFLMFAFSAYAVPVFLVQAVLFLVFWRQRRKRG